MIYNSFAHSILPYHMLFDLFINIIVYVILHNICLYCSRRTPLAPPSWSKQITGPPEAWLPSPQTTTTLLSQ